MDHESSTSSADSSGSDDSTITITVTENGPYAVDGPLPIRRETIRTDVDGASVAWEEGDQLPLKKKFALCRCGHSANKPFCDGSHERVHFDGTETASREPYLEQAEVRDGPAVILTDLEALCSFARFCDVGGQIWNLVEQGDEESVRLAEREARDCPSGRLIIWDRGNREPTEQLPPGTDPSIGLVEDPAEGVAGPLWVRGGIRLLSADGTPYEVRTKMTLCRCGASENKPFCDGSHVKIGFQDQSSARSAAAD